MNALLNPSGQVFVHIKSAITGANAAPIAIPTPAGVAHSSAESKLLAKQFEIIFFNNVWSILSLTYGINKNAFVMISLISPTTATLTAILVMVDAIADRVVDVATAVGFAGSGVNA